MTGDVLVPVLITFLVVNVVLVVRAWAKGQIRRPRAAVAGRSPRVSLAAGPAAPVLTDAPVAARPAAPDPTEVPAAPAPAEVPPTPFLTDAPVAVVPPTPDPTEVPPTPVPSGRDVLSSLDDEATWDRRVADENARLVRYRRPVTIVRLELAGLDRLVGLLGNEAGDRLLRAMADTLRRLARDTDHIAHLGHGNFGVLMPETSEEAAVVFVDRVNRACALWLESAAIAVRLDIGWAATSGEAALADVRRLATERMHAGPWRAAPRAGAVIADGPAPKAAARPSLTVAPPAVAPRLSWATCRDPNCNHKEDHRRDRRR